MQRLCVELMSHYCMLQLVTVVEETHAMLQHELSLYGNQVACVAGQCSNCQESRAAQECWCRVWRCGCEACEGANGLDVAWTNTPAPAACMSTSTVEKPPAMALVTRECLAIYRAHWPRLLRARAQVVQVSRELALFGSTVGCINDRCSMCLLEPGECGCKAWTCRCTLCSKERHAYKKIAGTPADVMKYKTI